MLCAIARIDRLSRTRLTELQRLAARQGIAAREVYGHITLATCLGADEAGFVSACKAALAQREAFSVYYDRVELLGEPPIIAACPRLDGTLSALQKALAGPCEDQLDQWTRPSVWHPHTTLIVNPGIDLRPLAQRMREHFVPFRARVGRIEFSRVERTGYRIIDAVELIKRAE